MQTWKSIGIAIPMALGIGLAALAHASHEHYIDTPGTCVADVGRGQTSKGPGEGGYHQFHENVHLGQPGAEAFANEANPVSVGKGGCP